MKHTLLGERKVLAQSDVEINTQISESNMEDDIEVPILDESDGRVYQTVSTHYR